MTRIEYEKRRASIASSLAHPRVKEDAIQKLNIKFYGTEAIKAAREQIEESKADISDIGGQFE